MDFLKKVKEYGENVLQDIKHDPQMLLGIPVSRKNVSNLAQAFREADPELAQKEFLDIAGTAALMSIPFEKLLSPVFKPLMSPLKGVFDSFKGGVTKLSEPMGKIANRWGWEPARVGLSKVRTTDTLDPISKVNWKESSDWISKKYNEIKQDRLTFGEGKNKVDLSVEELLKHASETMPRTPITTFVDYSQFNPLKNFDIRYLSPFEQKVLTAFSGPFESWKEIMDIPNSIGMASPRIARGLLMDKAGIVRHIEPHFLSLFGEIDKYGKKLGIKNLGELAYKARENPTLRSQLPKEVQHLPDIIGAHLDTAFNILKEKGYDIHYWDNYITHILRGWESLEKNSLQIRKVSDFVKWMEPRKFGYTVDTLKDIADDKIIRADQLPGWEKFTEEEKTKATSLFNEARPYIRGKQVITDPAKALSAYFSAFAHAELAKSIENVLKESFVHPNFSWLRGSITPEEQSALKHLFTTTGDALRNEGNTEGADQLLNAYRIVDAYKPGESIGMSPDRLYHPSLAPIIKKNLLLPTPGTLKKGISNVLSVLKSFKLSLSGFHSGNFSNVVLTNGLGLDYFFIPKDLKHFATVEGKKEMAEAQAVGLNLFLPKRLLQETWEVLDRNTGGTGVLSKTAQILEKNPLTHFIFEMQGPVDQMKIYEARKPTILRHISELLASPKGLDNKGILDFIKGKGITSRDIGQAAAHLVNIEMGSLRPEAMSEVAREMGNMFFLARNWTYSNFYLLLNAFNEWFVKTPSAIGILPKRVSELFLQGMDSMQTMNHLPLEAQLAVRKELADFVGVAMARYMWRLQVANYLLSGHSSYENGPGHELSIDSGLVEIKSNKAGNLTPRRVYLNGLGWLGDIFNLSPFHLPLSNVVHTGNIKEILKPWNYFDLGKISSTAMSKFNIAWHSIFDINRALMFTKDIQARNQKIVESMGKPFVPISIDNMYNDLVKNVKNPRTALEIVLMNVLGFPRKQLGQ